MCTIDLSSYRTVWMFPRNIRMIHPWKIAQVVTVIQSQVAHATWSGNRQVQESLTKALEQAHLKRAGTQRDRNSGGARTYVAQLRQLGLIFKRDNSLLLTTAGSELVEGAKPLPTLQEQLMRLQFPSAYSLGRGVKIDPRIKVKPFVFVMQLLADGRLDGWLSEPELCIPIVFGHNHDCLDYCVDKIREYRAGTPLSSLMHVDVDFHLPQSRNPLRNIADVANTLKCYMKACALITEEMEEDGVTRIRIRPESNRLLIDALPHVDQFIPNPDIEESFQRAFGSPAGKKDTRVLRYSDKAPLTAEQTLILARFFEYCGSHVFDSMPHQFVDALVDNFGFSANAVVDAISPHLSRSIDLYESSFIELAHGGTRTALAFEKALTTLLSERLGLRAAHTGQRRRPPGKIGGYADVLLVRGDRPDVALIDAKATRAYKLPSADARAMEGSYSQQFRELTEDRGVLSWCAYVAGGFAPGAAQRTEILSRNIGAPVAPITAQALLHLAKKSSPADAEETFDRLKSSPAI